MPYKILNLETGEYLESVAIPRGFHGNKIIEYLFPTDYINYKYSHKVWDINTTVLNTKSLADTILYNYVNNKCNVEHKHYRKVFLDSYEIIKC